MVDDVKEKLHLLTENYARQLPNKISEIEQQWFAVKSKHENNDIETLTRNVHTLAGTAGTFGYDLISQVARDLERLLEQSKAGTNTTSIIELLISDLKQLAINPPQSKEDKNRNIEEISDIATKTIYFLGEMNGLLLNHIHSMDQFDYQVKATDQIEKFMTDYCYQKVAMVIMDITFAKKLNPSFLKQIHDEMTIIVYSAEDTLENRLFSIRHHGQAFLAQTADMNTVLRLIDNLFEAKSTRYGKILLVDDSKFLTEYYATVLERAGFIVYKLNDPKKFLPTMQEYQPDLLLLDINMPFCSGAELAQIVLQQENLIGMPIIFLSSIVETEKQLELLRLAGDDFLTKPVDPKHLVSAVRNRLLRSRILRARMMRDGLTNLYNHTMIHHQLEREIMIAERYKRELSLILLDLDHFKVVNDIYGHQAGDKVLKDLSTFLLRHLRKSDMVGRYGGEEFLIILPNTTSEQAVAIVNELRKQFVAIAHNIGDKSISVSFSAGVASYSDFKEKNRLVRAADDALYQAKNRGRNQIVTLRK